MPLNMSNSKPSSDLFNLVKSFTQDEVMYFHKYISKQRTNERSNFLQLFYLIKEQEQYDENALKSSLSDRKWAKRLTYSKNELQQYIVDSLFANNSNTTTERDIHYLLDLAELLKKKSLHKLALKN